MIKILHVQLTDNFGGIESLLLNVYSKIDRNTFQFDFIANNKAPYQIELAKLGANIYVMPSIKNYITYKKKFMNILDNNYDIVHFHKNSAANIVPVLWAKHHYSHPKIIIHSHNSAPSINNKWLFFLHKLNRHLLNQLADKKIACSNLAARWMFGSSTDVDVIYNGVDLSRFSFSQKARSSVRKYYNLKPNTLIFGNVGRFSEQKNQLFLLNIFYQALQLNDNILLFLIGTGQLKPVLVKKAKELSITNKVIFLGNKTNVQDYLSAMDIYIAPSLYEGLGISLIEAQAEGLPLFLSSKIPDETIVTDLVKSFTLSTSAAQIAELILKTKLSFKNRAKYSAELSSSPFDINQTVKSIEKMYLDIIHNN